jgi:hypothetical protein
MSREIIKVPTQLSIPIGQQVSNAIPWNALTGTTAFMLFGRTIGDNAHVFNVQFSNDDGTTFFTLNDGTSDIPAPPNGKCMAYPNPPATHLRIRDTVVTTAANIWELMVEAPIY